VNQWAADHTTTLAGGRPVLVLDMYEHAYHMDYGAAAGRYVDAFMEAIRWDNAVKLYEQYGPRRLIAYPPSEWALGRQAPQPPSRRTETQRPPSGYSDGRFDQLGDQVRIRGRIASVARDVLQTDRIDRGALSLPLRSRKKDL